MAQASTAQVAVTQVHRYKIPPPQFNGAATTCRQHATNTGFKIWRRLHNRFSMPIDTRSVGYLTKLLKPQFDELKFEESYTTWELHLQLQAGSITTYAQTRSLILEDHRASTTFARHTMTQASASGQGPAPQWTSAAHGTRRQEQQKQGKVKSILLSSRSAAERIFT